MLRLGDSDLDLPRVTVLTRLNKQQKKEGGVFVHPLVKYTFVGSATQIHNTDSRPCP